MIGRNAGRAGIRSAKASPLCAGLLATSALVTVPQAVSAQTVAPVAAPAAPLPPAVPVPAGDVIRTVTVQGSQRLEPDTILSYIRLRPGQTYTQALGDQALKDLYATELFADEIGRAHV